MPDTPEVPSGPTTEVDTGDFLHVPEDERLDEDDVVAEEIAEDAHRIDFADVPDGEVVDLTALPVDDEADDEEQP